MTETLYTTDTPMQRLAAELADLKGEGALRGKFSVLDVEAVVAQVTAEREWWESIREDHADSLMILKEASLKRLA